MKEYIWEYSEEEETTLEDKENEIEGETLPKISFNAPSGSSNTMRIKEKIQNQTVTILIYSGSSHNFLNEQLAKKLHLLIKHQGELKVIVANGDNMVCGGKCINVALSI